MILFCVISCDRFTDADSARLPEGGGEILVFGDSISTGAVTHPNFTLDYEGILRSAITGEHTPSGAGVASPVRVGKPLAEIPTFGDGGGNERAAKALLGAIEWPELSWGSNLATIEARPTDRVAIAARNGAQAKNAPEEVETWLENRGAGRALPPETYVFFTGNDLCRAEDDPEPITAPEAFGASIAEAVRAFARAGQAPEGGATVYLVSHLDILQLAKTPDLLAKKRVIVTDARGKRELSCSEFLKEYEDATAKPLAQSDFEGALLRFTYHPMKSCASVLAHTAGLDPARAKVPLDSLSAQLSAYREQLAAVAAALPGDPDVQNAGVTVKLITTTHDLVMTPDDVANDCFHLSASGQRRLADAIAKGR